MWGLVYLCILLAGIWGYVANIIDVIGMRHVQITDFTLGMVCHVAGIFIPPLGSIMGLFF